MLPRGMNSFDSRATEPEQPKTPTRLPHRERKLSIEEIESDCENIFGVFNLDDYIVMRGFIPGKGKNVRLHYTKLDPPKKKANVCIIPSYAGKPDDYLDIADYFAKQQLVVHILSLRGLSSSAGIGINSEIGQIFSDIECLLRCCEAQIPIFLCAFGFGCTLLMSFLADNPHLPISGIIMISPSLIVPQKWTSIPRFVMRWISRRFLGDLLVYLPLNIDHLTKNNNHLKKIIDQGSQVQYIKLDILKKLQNASEYMIANAVKINYPVLLYYGLMNNFSCTKLIQSFFEKITSGDKTVRTFQRGFHYLQADQQTNALKPEAARWMLSRAGQSKGKGVTKIPQLIILNEFPKRVTWKRVLYLIGVIMFVWKFLIKRKLGKY